MLLTTQLKILAKNCKYHDVDEAVRDQLLLNITDDKAREKLMDKVLEGTVPNLANDIGLLRNIESRK